MMVALSFNEDIVPLTSSSQQSAPLKLFLDCAFVDRYGLKMGFSTKFVGDLTGTRLLNKRNRDSEVVAFHSLVL